MSSQGMPRPFAVAAYFGDGNQGNLELSTQIAVNVAHATGLVVSQHYTLRGGKLPLVMTSAMEIQRDTLETALQLLDAIDAADKADEAKVVSIVRQDESAVTAENPGGFVPIPLPLPEPRPGVCGECGGVDEHLPGCPYEPRGPAA